MSRGNALIDVFWGAGGTVARQEDEERRGGFDGTLLQMQGYYGTGGRRGGEEGRAVTSPRLLVTGRYFNT